MEMYGNVWFLWSRVSVITRTHERTLAFAAELCTTPVTPLSHTSGRQYIAGKLSPHYNVMRERDVCMSKRTV